MNATKFGVVNIFIMRRFMKYSDPVKNLVQSLCNNAQIFTLLTDYHLRLENRDHMMINAELGIILMEDFENTRYDSSPDWLKLMSKKIFECCSEVLVLVYGNKRMWENYKILGNNCKVECMNYTIDDDYNIAIIKEKLINNIIVKKL